MLRQNTRAARATEGLLFETAYQEETSIAETFKRRRLGLKANTETRGSKNREGQQVTWRIEKSGATSVNWSDIHVSSIKLRSVFFILSFVDC